MNTDIAYYGNIRPEVLALMNLPGSRMLDIGCGLGAMAAEAKRRGAAAVYGIEFEPAVAKAAQTILDGVIVGSVESAEIPWRDFDYITCADVLEHLPDPWAVLRKLRAHLSPTGKLVASIPNLAHHSVLLAILRDKFAYQEGGILDRTHLRFFTKHTIEDLFRSSGYGIETIGSKCSAGLKDKGITAISFGTLRHLTVLQYLVVAKAA